MSLSLLAAAVLWLLTVVGNPPVLEPTMGGGSVGQWAGVIIAFGWGLAFLLRGIFLKDPNASPLKKLQIIFGVLLIAVGVLVLVEIFTWSEGGARTAFMPIIAVALALAVLISVVFVGGRKWDEADNEKKDSQPSRPKTEWEKRQETLAREQAEKDAAIAANQAALQNQDNNQNNNNNIQG